MGFDKGSPEYEMMGEYFKLTKKYWNMTHIDWAEMINEVDNFVVKHDKKTRGFAQRLAMQLLNQCDAMSKGDV